MLGSALRSPRLSGGRGPWLFDPSAERIVEPDSIDLAYPIVLDHSTPAAVVKALCDAATSINLYPHREAEVRQALADYLGVRPTEVLPTAGANGALDLIARTFLARRRVTVPIPAFWQLIEAPRRFGAALTFPNLLGPDGADRGSDLVEAFAQADAAILCSPNNPLGRTLDRDLLRTLLATSTERPIIVDESYADMSGETALAAISVKERVHPDLLLVRGFKTFLIPGVRAGYIVGSEERIARLHWMRPPFEVGAFAEAAILAVLGHLDEIRAIWDRVGADRRAFEVGLLALGGAVEPSPTVFTCWRHPRALEIGRALAAANIYAIFADRPVIRGMPHDALRMTVRTPEVACKVLTAITEILDRLERIEPLEPGNSVLS